MQLVVLYVIPHRNLDARYSRYNFCVGLVYYAEVGHYIMCTYCALYYLWCKLNAGTIINSHSSNFQSLE